MENINQIIQYLKSELHELDIIYKFGSQVKGSLHKGSDLDIAIKCTHSIEAERLWLLSVDLADIANCHVDLIDLSQASTVMRLQIVDKGVCLYAKEANKRTIFEYFVYSDYVRLSEERKWILKDISSRGTVYG